MMKERFEGMQWPSRERPGTIDGLDLSVRAWNAVSNAGLDQLADLLQRTEAEVRRNRGIGGIVLRELKKKLMAHGLALRPEIGWESAAREAERLAAAEQDEAKKTRLQLIADHFRRMLIYGLGFPGTAQSNLGDTKMPENAMRPIEYINVPPGSTLLVKIPTFGDKTSMEEYRQELLARKIPNVVDVLVMPKGFEVSAIVQTAARTTGCEAGRFDICCSVCKKIPVCYAKAEYLLCEECYPSVKGLYGISELESAIEQRKLVISRMNDGKEGDE